MKYDLQRSIDLNRSFSHSRARYRRRLNKRAWKRVFAAGAITELSGWDIFSDLLSQSCQWIRDLFARKPKRGTMSPRATALMEKYSQPTPLARSISQDTKHRPQHRK